MLNDDEMKDAALLVFANKQDQPGAKGAGDISEALNLGELRDRNWTIMACSAVDGRGVSEGMDWLVVSQCSLRLFIFVLTLLAANSPVGSDLMFTQILYSNMIPFGRLSGHIPLKRSFALCHDCLSLRVIRLNANFSLGRRP